MNVGGPQGLPLTKPPYGRIVATNLNRGEHEWVIPHGEGFVRRSLIWGFSIQGLLEGPVGQDRC